MIGRIKNIILKKYMDFRLKWFKADKQPLEFSSALKLVKNILLIAPVDHAELDEDVHHFASELYKIIENVRVSTFERSTFRPDDGNWFGLPNDSYMDNFRQENFDLVIDLNVEQDRLCTYICALSGAGLRINLTSGKYDHIYNFHIRSNESKTVSARFESILKYLRSFIK